MKDLLESPACVMRFSIRGIVYRIPFDEILYMESLNRSVVVHTWERDLAVPYLRLADCEEKGVGGFIRCHRSILVNMHYIREIRLGKRQIVLDGGKGEVAIGRKYIPSVKGIFDVDRMPSFTKRTEIM